jgi:peptide/nickel transport system permease protein
MIRIIAARSLELLPALLIVSVMVFLLQKMMPGDVAIALAGEDRNMEAIAYIREKYHLGEPIITQYWYWLRAVLSGDFGNSIKMGSPVAAMVLEKLWVTFQLSTLAMGIAIALGVPLGILAAVRPGSFWDLVGSLFALSALSVPPFWLGILLILIVSIHLGWLPASGYVPFFENPVESLRVLIMPAFVLGAAIAAMLMRHVRSAMLEILGADYIRTAAAKGVPERRIILVHALRNSAIPVVAFAGIIFGELLAGAVLTEQIFNIPGMGKLVVDSVFNRDYTVVQGVVLCSALLYFIINLIADILIALIDPRVSA